MTSTDLKNYAMGIMAAGITILAVTVAFQIRTIGNQTSAALTEITQTAKQTKLAAFEIQAASKAARYEWESPEYARARLQTLRLGDSAQVALAQINRDVIPGLVRTTEQARTLIANSDQRINAELLPQLTISTRNLADLAVAFKTDEQQIALELVKSIQAGQASITQVNRLLESENIPGILANLNRATGELASTSENIKLMSAQWPEMATEINKILKTGRQWQRPVMIAGLLAQLARMFF
jgi:hypothetical protein